MASPFSSGNGRATGPFDDPVEVQKPSAFGIFLNGYGAVGTELFAIVMYDSMVSAVAVGAQGIEFVDPPDSCYDDPAVQLRLREVRLSIEELNEHRILVDRDAGRVGCDWLRTTAMSRAGWRRRNAMQLRLQRLAELPAGYAHAPHLNPVRTVAVRQVRREAAIGPWPGNSFLQDVSAAAHSVRWKLWNGQCRRSDRGLPRCWSPVDREEHPHGSATDRLQAAQ